jgi:ribosomal protein L37AE/L43A
MRLQHRTERDKPHGQRGAEQEKESNEFGVLRASKSGQHAPSTHGASQGSSLALKPTQIPRLHRRIPQSQRRPLNSFVTTNMSHPPCPACTVDDVLSHPNHWECATCGHEWPKEAAPEAARADYDAGVAMQDFDRAHVTVGEAVGLLHDAPSAAVLIERITRQAAKLLH